MYYIGRSILYKNKLLIWSSAHYSAPTTGAVSKVLTIATGPEEFSGLSAAREHVIFT